MKRPSTFALALTALIANTVVILQGAVVRATGSGAGCGSHWPTCNGTVVPLNPTLETGIEFSHRLLSLAVLLLGVWLLVRTRKARHERPGLAAFGAISFGFLVFEALIGGATVLLGMTGDNTTVARGIWVASHLVNSLFLIGALAGTVVYARRRAPAWPLRLGRQGPLAALLIVGLLGMQLLMFTGGIAAMGNTIFPAESLAEGLRADFDAGSHPLIRLRVLHERALPGVRAIEVGVEIGGGVVALPCVVVRVQDDSPAYRALPHSVHWVRGRTGEERVTILRPRVPTRGQCLQLLTGVLRLLSAGQEGAKAPRRGARVGGQAQRGASPSSAHEAPTMPRPLQRTLST